MSQAVRYAGAMPNPEFNNDRGPCQACNGYGGVYEPEAKYGATTCRWPQKSGKSVSRMPEVGCSGFERRPGATERAAVYPKKPARR